MNKVSSIDTDDILYQLIQQAVNEGVITISGVVCPQGERPDDSKAEDIVINTITVTHDKPQTGTSNVNIYASDLKVKINGKEVNLHTVKDAIDNKLVILVCQHRSGLQFEIVANFWIIAEAAHILLDGLKSSVNRI